MLNKLLEILIHTLLSLSFGGSCGSEAEGLEVGGESILGLSLGSVASALGICLSKTSFSAGAGEIADATLLGGFSDGATGVGPSLDFEIIATLVPGSTVSPSLAKN